MRGLGAVLRWPQFAIAIALPTHTTVGLNRAAVAGRNHIATGLRLAPHTAVSGGKRLFARIAAGWIPTGLRVRGDGTGERLFECLRPDRSGHGVVPQARAEPPGEGHPIFLDPVYLDQPAVALDRVKLELQRLAEMTKRMVELALGSAMKGRDSELVALRRRDEEVDGLHGAILTYLGQLSLRDLVEPLPRRIQEYWGVANYLENVGDAVETGFVSRGYRRMEAGVEFGPDTTQHIERLGGEAFGAYAKATTAFAERDLQAARDVLDSKDAFDRISADSRGRIAGLITEGSAKGLAAYRLCSEQIDGLNGIHTLARCIAAAMLDAHQG